MLTSILVGECKSPKMKCKHVMIGMVTVCTGGKDKCRKQFQEKTKLSYVLSCIDVSFE